MNPDLKDPENTQLISRRSLLGRSFLTGIGAIAGVYLANASKIVHAKGFFSGNLPKKEKNKKAGQTYIDYFD